ncbi:hypothetical protein MYX82_11510 [Acidobacteria bacterium AH-259-D05]|nr:hypothetical protein [Acidobacteria bacterium AH-259-D05]
MTERPDYSFVVRDNEQAAANALSEGRQTDTFLLAHTVVEALLRAFLRVDDPRRSFDKLVTAYEAYLKDQGYPEADFVDELRQFNRRRNRIVHQLWQRGYTYTNDQSKEAAEAAVVMYGLFIEWLETFDEGITKAGFTYQQP